MFGYVLWFFCVWVFAVIVLRKFFCSMVANIEKYNIVATKDRSSWEKTKRSENSKPCPYEAAFQTLL